MYHLISNLCDCGIFKKRTFVQSFADDKVSMDHTHDVSLKMLFKKLDFTNNSMKKYNPTIKNENETFYISTEKGNMLQRNALLLSRVFMKNAKKSGLDTHFKDKKTLRILDIGCGHALNLIGILTLLGDNKKLEYIGVDINEQVINESKQTYAKMHFPNVTFKTKNGLEVLKAKENEGQFDLLLIQHPTLENMDARKVFKDIFMQAEKVLNVGGIVYSSFYYASEAKYFKDDILPALKGTLQENRGFNARLINRFTGEEYVPENFCYMSQAKEVKLIKNFSV